MNARQAWWGFASAVVLAGLDLLGSYLAKEFSTRPRWLLMAAGLSSFGLLFVVYVRSLRLVELWVVTFGWVVLLEIGVLLIDHFRFNTSIPPHKLFIAGLIVILQVWLLVPSSSAEPPREGVAPPSAVATRSPGASPRERPLPFAWAERPDPREQVEHRPRDHADLSQPVRFTPQASIRQTG